MPRTQTVNELADRMRELIGDNDRNQLLEMAKEYEHVFEMPPKSANKHRLAEYIAYSESGIAIVTPGRKSRATPVTTRTKNGITRINHREDGYRRNVRMEPDSRGNLSSSFTMATEFGSRTVTERIYHRNRNAFEHAKANNKAGIAGTMFDCTENDGIKAMAEAWKIMSAPASRQRRIEEFCSLLE